MRAIGIDLGTRRIGVAVSDSGGALATPLTTLERHRDRQADHRAIGELAREWEAEVIVVGLPRSLSGLDGPAAESARTEVNQLASSMDCPVELFDERLTTAVAHRSLDTIGVPHARRRAMVDQIAASVILQGWLDRRREADQHPLPESDEAR